MRKKHLMNVLEILFYENSFEERLKIFGAENRWLNFKQLYKMQWVILDAAMWMRACCKDQSLSLWSLNETTRLGKPSRRRKPSQDHGASKNGKVARMFLEWSFLRPHCVFLIYLALGWDFLGSKMLIFVKLSKDVLSGELDSLTLCFFGFKVCRARNRHTYVSFHNGLRFREVSACYSRQDFINFLCQRRNPEET